MRTVGLDISTCTGMALVGEGEDRGKTIEVPNERGLARLHLIAMDVVQTLKAWQPAFVVVEDYAYVKNISSFVKLVELGTVTRMSIRQQGIPFLTVPPTVLKKWTTGKGNASKDQMAVAAFEKWQYKSRSDDIIDAYCLAQMAQLGWDEMLQIKGVTVGWKLSI